METTFHLERARQRQQVLLEEAERWRLARHALGEETGALRQSRSERWQEWQAAYCRLIEDIARRGFYLERNSELSRWVGEQQNAHRLGRLGRKRTRLLGALPGWNWGPVPFITSFRLAETLRLSSWAGPLVDNLTATTDESQKGLVLAMNFDRARPL